MSGRVHTTTYYVITCDGCGTKYSDTQVREPAQTRKQAAADGWEQVPRLKRNGQPRNVNPHGRGGGSGDDVCPVCLPGWKPRFHDNPNAPAWTNDPAALRRRAEQLEAEQTTEALAEALTAAAEERADDYARQAGPWPDHLKDGIGGAIAGKTIAQPMTHPDLPDSHIVVTTEGSMEAHRRSGWQVLENQVEA